MQMWYTLLLSLLLLMLGAASPARADLLETLLMPGELIEGHAEYETDCDQCHESFSKKSQRHLCLDCHEAVAADITAHTGYHGQLANADTVTCHTCHTDHKGRDADIVQFNASSFDHTQTDFALKGKHSAVACRSCHQPDEKFRDAADQCIDCHKDTDPHQGNLGEACADCHTESSWQETEFDHDKTDFPLKDKHQETNCSSCHPDDQYEAVSSRCVSCHLVNDTHAGKRGDKCEDCHSTQGWDKSRFNHDTATDFKLEGAHSKVSCEQCHHDPVYDKAPPDTCIGCHKNDDRHNGRNGKKCNDCHTANNWSRIRFDHNSATDFPLNGKHADARCESCHKGELSQQLEGTCISCHRGEDVHAGQLGTQCEQCHNEKAFSASIRFDHDLSKFPLIGQHAVVSCDECHPGQTFKDTALACISCHKDDDSHKAALGTECGSCHTPNDWALWRFDHNRQTQFELDGKHKGLACQACHSTPATNGVKQQSSCDSCHRADDIHAGGFGRNCERCHSTDSFSDSQKLTWPRPEADGKWMTGSQHHDP